MYNFMTVKEASEKWGVSVRWVQTLCNDKKIEGAMKFGRAWAIPCDAERPIDSRLITGEYVNWRRKNKEEKGDRLC